MKVSPPMFTLALMPIEILIPIEILTDLPQAIGHRTLRQLDEMKAAVEIGAPDVRTQFLRLGEGLRPLGIVHENLAPRWGEKNRGCVRAGGRSPGIRCALPALAQLADQVGQSAIEKTPPVPRTVGKLGAHSLAA